MLLNVPHPVPHVVEGPLVGHVVRQQDAMGSPVVRVGDRAEPFLARGVPNLKLHALPVKLHRADLEVYADRRDEAARELVLGETQQQAALAHAW